MCANRKDLMEERPGGGGAMPWTDCMDRNITDWSKIKNVIKDALSDFIWKKTKRSPMIMPIIMDVDV